MIGKTKFYSLDNIIGKNAQYNIVIGERSNGKTYSVLKYALERYIKTGEQLAIIRRWGDDFKGKRGQMMFANHVANDEITSLTDGKWSDVYYYGGRWFLCGYDEDGKRMQDETPFAFGFSLTATEHDKSTGYPNITTICFDEFISRSAYIPDEFVLFMNTLSTIIRYRDNVKIFMLGNTVNKYCPYFDEMGLKHIRNMEQGAIDVYTYGSSQLRVAVEYCSPLNKKGKKSDLYFAFDNPKLSMITGGAWEIDVYPHLPHKYRPQDIAYIFFVQFGGDVLQGEVITTSDDMFIFFHRKTSDIKDDTALVYSTEHDARPNYRRNILKPMSNLERRVVDIFKRDKVFYSTNEVGEIVRNYLLWCGKSAV